MFETRFFQLVVLIFIQQRRWTKTPKVAIEGTNKVSRSFTFKLRTRWKQATCVAGSWVEVEGPISKTQERYTQSLTFSFQLSSPQARTFSGGETISNPRWSTDPQRQEGTRQGDLCNFRGNQRSRVPHWSIPSSERSRILLCWVRTRRRRRDRNEAHGRRTNRQSGGDSGSHLAHEQTRNATKPDASRWTNAQPRRTVGTWRGHEKPSKHALTWPPRWPTFSPSQVREE